MSCSLTPGLSGRLSLVSTLVTLLLSSGCPRSTSEEDDQPSGNSLLEKGRYLATIGVCEACHTPPTAAPTPPTSPNDILAELQLRANPDWFKYLDGDRRMAGGVPFIVRFGPSSHAVVYSKNISPDAETGIGTWSIEDIVTVLRTGKRKDGTILFLFAPHTFFKDLALNDAVAIATYLKSLPPKKSLLPANTPLPFPLTPMQPTSLVQAPQGRTHARSTYLMNAIVGCKECHSYHNAQQVLQEFVGGDPSDPFVGVFRFGPDLPLRFTEKGFATFPFPGFAILYGPNLTRYGIGGDLNKTSASTLASIIRTGIDSERDAYNRPQLLSHVMMWQFYRSMRKTDALAIADHIKTLNYVDHKVTRLTYFGTSWEVMFEKIFGSPPTDADRNAFGK